MAMRPSWDGFLKLKLLSIPVKAYSAGVSGGGKVGFHLLHAKCKSRIHYKKVCPIHGEVSNDEIVSGYEYAKNEYAVVEADERKQLKSDNDKGVDIDVFIRPEDLDPIYYSGKSYYLVPSGRVAEKPYAVLQQVMMEKDRFAIARVVISGRSQLGVVRPANKLLVLSMLNFESQLQKAGALEDEAPHVKPSGEEHHLAETLVALATAKRFDFANYHDEYNSKLTELVEKKVAKLPKGQKSDPKEPAIINLMDALRRSLATETEVEKKPSKRTAKPVNKASRHAKNGTIRGRKRTG